MRFLTRRLADQSSARTADMRELRLSGGMDDGVWGQLKALLVMTPRRALMLGGMEELHMEERRAVGQVLRAARAKANHDPADLADASDCIVDAEDNEDVTSIFSDLHPLMGTASFEQAPRIDAAREHAATAETIVSALQSAPLRTLATRPDAHGLGADALTSAISHLPSDTQLAARRRRVALQAHENDDGNKLPSANDASLLTKTPLLARHGSLTEGIWTQGGGRQLIDPQMVLAEAQRLDVDLTAPHGDFFLLPIVVESCRAPLPSGWSELLRRGEVMYIEETELERGPQIRHPLADSFAEVVRLERRRQRRMSGQRRTTLPSWLEQACEQWMQFVGVDGSLYFYDFATGETVTDLVDIFRRANPEGFRSARELLDEEMRRDHTMDSAGGGNPGLGGVRFERLLDAVIDEKGVEATACRREREAAEQSLRSLRSTFNQLLGNSLASAPRQLLQTVTVALKYGLRIEKEPQFVWLADLALALPLPAGWVQVDHPHQHGCTYWHNEICGSSQWAHPVDDFIKAIIKAQRAAILGAARRAKSAGAGDGERGMSTAPVGAQAEPNYIEKKLLLSQS